MKKSFSYIGSSNFLEIRNENSYYVDKTKFIEELLSQVNKVSLITRPRRFGKTLMLSMLKEFFDIGKDSKKLFNDMEVSRMPIEANIEEYFTYENLYNSDDAILNLLYFTGYLTAHKGEKQQEQNNNGGSRALLSIPNKEIQYIFKRKVEEWFLKSMRSSDRSKLFTAFWECDEQVFSELVSEILLQSISYYDSQAEFCHGFVAGLFIGSGYNLQSNKEYGNGRPDIVVFDERHKRIGIIEVKFTKDRHTFANLAHISLDQILCRKYAEAFSPQKDICLVHWGLAFYQKQCRAVGKKVEFCTADSDK
ncbi:MAG: ATP-binding protein [Desulfovibrio sp.]|nr:ATP-binding protein [Desulfovibrio sp.]